MPSNTPDPTEAARKLLQHSQHAKVMAEMETQTAYLAGFRRKLIAEGWSTHGAEAAVVAVLQSGAKR